MLHGFLGGRGCWRVLQLPKSSENKLAAAILLLCDTFKSLFAQTLQFLSMCYQYGDTGYLVNISV